MSETNQNKPDKTIPIPQTANAFLEDGIRLVKSTADRDEEDQACPICFRPYIQQELGEGKINLGGKWSLQQSQSDRSHEQPVQILTCGHIFGEECLTSHVKCWEAHANKCPMCRTVLFNRFEGSVGSLQEDVAEAYEEVSMVRRLTQQMRRLVGRIVRTNPTLAQELIPGLEQREILLSQMEAQHAEFSEAARQLTEALGDENTNRSEL